MSKIPLLDLPAQYGGIKAEIHEAIQRVCDKGVFILGPEVRALEEEFKASCGSKYAVAVASGTDALELSLRAYGIGRGDEVVLPALSCFATASAVAALGARPVFVDVEPATYTIDPLLIEQAITPRTKAILPVHLYGQPCDMQAILEIARERGVRVIEDCAQAFGAAIGGQRVGTFGDAGAFSFYPTKNLGAYGDGGMVLTDRCEVAERIQLFRTHGSHDGVHHDVVSRNSRLDEIQAAILRVKLRHVEAWNEARRARTRTYRQVFRQHRVPGLILPQERPESRHVYHLYVVRVQQRKKFQQMLAEEGISTLVHYEVPLHLEPAFASLGYRPGAFPHAERLTAEIVSLPLYPELTPEAIERVVGVIARHQAQWSGRTVRTRRSLTVFFPCYNDAPTIKSLVMAADAVASEYTDDYEIIVVDDGSTDESPEVLRILQQDYARLRVVTHEHNRGYGGALQSGFAHATKDLVFYTDGDGQYDVFELRQLLAALRDDVDVVNGYKVSRSDPLYRSIIGTLYLWGVRILFHPPVWDVNCDFRLIRRHVFDSIRLEQHSAAICVELVKKLQRANCRFANVPVSHLPRRYGTSRFLTFRNLWRTATGLASLWWALMVRREGTEANPSRQPLAVGDD